MRPSKEKQNDYNTDNNWPRRYFRNPIDRDSNHRDDGDWCHQRGDFMREKSISSSAARENHAQQDALHIRVVKENINATFSIETCDQEETFCSISRSTILTANSWLVIDGYDDSNGHHNEWPKATAVAGKQSRGINRFARPIGNNNWNCTDGPTEIKRHWEKMDGSLRQ